MKKICFVGLDNYPVLNPEWGNEYFGGESVQQTLLAKAFVKHGWEVSTVVADIGQPDDEVIGGIKVIKSFNRAAGLPVLRFIYPRMTSFFRALREADADVYYQSCAGIYTGMVAKFCKRHNRKFIFRVAHDTDCIPGKQIIEHHRWRDVPIYEFGLKNAGLIAAQGVVQQELLTKNYALGSSVINMAVQPPEEDLNRPRNIDVLWVNNLRHFKRPELLLDLAEAMPEISFTMIGGPVVGLEQYYSDLENRAETIPNLDFRGAVSYSDVNSYFARAKVFVNTSESEGFPNSFLQAWIRGVPVISYFDPDHLIDKHSLGCSPKDTLDDMVAAIESILGDTHKLAAISAAAKNYAEKFYVSSAVSQRYIDWINVK